MKSSNSGKTFDWDQNGNVGLDVRSRIGVNVHDPNLIFIPVQDYNFAVTQNGGDTWRAYQNSDDIAGYGYGSHNYGGYAADAQTTFFGRSGDWDAKQVELSVTYDRFATVTRTGIMTYAPSALMHRYTAAPNDTAVWFADNYRSANAGKTWNVMDGCTLVLDYDRRSGDLYGLDKTYQKVVISADNGASWVEFADFSIYPGLAMITDLAYDCQNEILYVCQSPAEANVAWWSHLVFVGGQRVARAGALWKVRDGAVQELTGAVQGAAYAGGDPVYVAIDPRYPDVIYTGLRAASAIANEDEYRGSQEYGVLRSVNGGRSFQVLSANGTNSIVPDGSADGKNVSDIEINPETDVLFVATDCYGLWKFAPPY